MSRQRDSPSDSAEFKKCIMTDRFYCIALFAHLLITFTLLNIGNFDTAIYIAEMNIVINLDETHETPNLFKYEIEPTAP